MKKLLVLMLSLLVTGAYAQKKKKQDIEAIKSMCGCYDITFNFAETFSPKKDYEFHENYKAGALEYVFPVEETDDKIVIQHLLIVGDTMIIKHWRQDWIYENQDLYTFDKDNTWKYVSKSADEVKGQWTQKVFQVDDSPRYEGSATWVHVDGKHYWESTSDAPLPRREFSKRDDYNVMQRTNRHEITEDGWIHEQDNAKVVRGENDEIIAWEKGLNTYDKLPMEECAVAKRWWENNKNYWADVRDVWDEVFGTKQTVSIEMMKDGSLMFDRLFALGDEMAGANYDSSSSKEKIRDVIRMHLKNDKLLANK